MPKSGSLVILDELFNILVMLKAGFDEVHYGLWVKLLSDSEYEKIYEGRICNEEER